MSHLRVVGCVDQLESGGVFIFRLKTLGFNSVKSGVQLAEVEPWLLDTKFLALDFPKDTLVLLELGLLDVPGGVLLFEKGVIYLSKPHIAHVSLVFLSFHFYQFLVFVVYNLSIWEHVIRKGSLFDIKMGRRGSPLDDRSHHAVHRRTAVSHPHHWGSADITNWHMLRSAK